MKKILYILFFISSFCGFSQLTKSQLTTLYDEQVTNVLALNNIYEDFIYGSETNGANQEHYFLAYWLDADIRAWQATGDIKYFNRAKLVIDNIIGNAVDLTSGGNSGYKGWVISSGVSGGATYLETDGAQLFEFYWARHAVHLLAVLKSNPSFVSANNLTAWLSDTQDFIGTHIVQKWWQNSNATAANNWVYRNYIQIAAMSMITCAYMDKLTGNSGFDYRTIWQNIAYNGIPPYSGNTPNNVRDALILTSGSYSWNKYLDDTSQSIDDTSHASDMANAVYSMYELGLEFDLTDVQRLESALENVIVDNISNYDYNQYIDGTGSILSQQSVYMNGWHLTLSANPTFQNTAENNLDGNDTNQSDAGILLYARAVTDDTVIYPLDLDILDGVGNTGTPTVFLSNDDIKAFPTAKGHGKNATGGKGLPVYFVTNLNDSGSGSLRQIEQDIQNSGNGGNILFRTNGTIDLSSGLFFSTGVDNVTIYGQSATGNGITIHDNETTVRSSNFIMQHMKFRGGDGADAAHVQAFRIGGTNQNANRSNYAISNCSFTWGDNSGSFGVNLNPGDLNNTLTNFTLQNSIIGEGFNSKGMIAYGRGFTKASFIENALINNSERNMRSSIGQDNEYEFINNYIYGHTYGLQATAKNKIDVIGNVWEDGWATQGSSATIEFLDCSTGNCPPSGDTNYTGSELYNSDNLFNANAAPLNTNASNAVVGSRLAASTYTPYSSSIVKDSVLENAGARIRLEGLDAVDLHLVNDAKNGTGSYANNESGTIGMPTFTTAANYTDTDNDGLEDGWELLNGGLSLNHSDILDKYTFDTFKVDQKRDVTLPDADRYTALQVYMAHRGDEWSKFNKENVSIPSLPELIQYQSIINRRRF